MKDEWANLSTFKVLVLYGKFNLELTFTSDPGRQISMVEFPACLFSTAITKVYHPLCCFLFFFGF